MGKGLSQLQRDVIDILGRAPSYEATRGDGLSQWLLPRDILKALRREPSASNRAALSKALRRLHERGHVARAAGEMAYAGKAFRYALITDPKNAGAGNSGPRFVLGGPRIKNIRTIRVTRPTR